MQVLIEIILLMHRFWSKNCDQGGICSVKVSGSPQSPNQRWMWQVAWPTRGDLKSVTQNVQPRAFASQVSSIAGPCTPAALAVLELDFHAII